MFIRASFSAGRVGRQPPPSQRRPGWTTSWQFKASAVRSCSMHLRAREATVANWASPCAHSAGRLSAPPRLSAPSRGAAVAQFGMSLRVISPTFLRTDPLHVLVLSAAPAVGQSWAHGSRSSPRLWLPVAERIRGVQPRALLALPRIAVAGWVQRLADFAQEGLAQWRQRELGQPRGPDDNDAFGAEVAGD